MIRKKPIFYMAAVAAGLAVMPTWAGTYYVSQAGNDANSGVSREQPFRTINYAAQIAQAGDTVLIDGGVYRETVTPGNSGTAGSPIVFAPYPGEYVVVSGLDDVSTPWTEYTNGIYKTDIVMDLGHQNQVFRKTSDVNLWPDLSGGTNHASQRIEVSRPFFIEAGHVSFDGTNDFLNTPVGHLENGGFLLIGNFAVQGEGNASVILSWQESGSNQGTRYGFENYFSDSIESVFGNSNGGIFHTYCDGVLDAVPLAESWHLIGGSVEDNGADSASFMRIGGNHNDSNFPDGGIRELIVWDQAISDADRQKLEGYLAHKWGLQENLALTHPYRSELPQAWSPADLPGVVAWYDADSLTNSEEMMFEARWPNSLDVWNPAWATADSGTTPSNLVDTALPDYDWNGADMWIFQSPAWALYGQQVLGYGSGYLTTENNSIWENHQLKAGSSYYVQGCLDALDIEGEWFYDTAEEVLYLHVGGEPPGSGIEVKKRTNAFVLDGHSYVELHGVHIIGATISTDVNTSHLVMDGLDVRYPYFSDHFDSWQTSSGLVLNGDGHEFRNSELAWASGSGLVLNGNDAQVVNSYIHDCDFIGSYAAPLRLGNETKNAVISHNTISMAGRSCIAFGRSHRDHLIQYNDLSHAGQLTQDLGMTYVNICEAGGMEIRYNWVHDNDAGHIPSGIYFDHGSKNLLIHHNAIWGVERGGLHVNQYALGVLMFNNTVTSDDAGYLSKWGNLWPDDMYGCKLVNNVFTDILDTDGVEIEIAENTTNYTGLVSSKYLTAGSAPVDAGRIIPGITDGYVGSAPDQGAYELGGANWRVGHDFRSEPVVDTALSDCPYKNRIVNSCFEWSSLSPWTVLGANVEINVQAVNQGMVLTNTAMGGFQSLRLGAGINGIGQVLTNLLPNAAYEFRGRLRADSGESVRLRVAGCSSGDAVSEMVSGNAPNWSDTRVAFWTGPTTTSVTCYVEKTTEGTGVVYIDDFSAIYQFTDTDSDGLADSEDPDDDGDNMPDTWELDHGLDPLVPNLGDSDGDGMSDYNEYIAQTDPGDDTSVLLINGEFVDHETGHMNISFQTTDGPLYQLEFRTNLVAGDWMRYGETLWGHGESFTSSVAGLEASKFYRLSVSQEPSVVVADDNMESYVPGDVPGIGFGWTTVNASETQWVAVEEIESVFSSGKQSFHYVDNDASELSSLKLVNTFFSVTGAVLICFDINLQVVGRNHLLQIQGDNLDGIKLAFDQGADSAVQYKDDAGWHDLTPALTSGKWYRFEIRVTVAEGVDDTFNIRILDETLAEICDTSGCRFLTNLSGLDGVVFSTNLPPGQKGTDCFIDNFRVLAL